MLNEYFPEQLLTNAMNNLGSQWRTLQPHSPSELGLLTSSSGTFQRPGSRQITKSPQSMFQNFPPTSQNSGGMNFGNFGGFGNGMSGSGGGGLLSPGGLNSNSSRMSSGNAFDFGSGNRPEQQQQQQQQQLPNFGRSNGMFGGSFATSTSSSSSSRMMGSNGFDSRPITSNGFATSVSGGSSAFERSISGNLFDPMMSGSSSNGGGFNRQMSMPTNLCDHAGSVSNGFGSNRTNGSGSGNDGFRYNSSEFARGKKYSSRSKI